MKTIKIGNERLVIASSEQTIISVSFNSHYHYVSILLDGSTWRRLGAKDYFDMQPTEENLKDRASTIGVAIDNFLSNSEKFLDINKLFGLSYL